MAFGSPGLRSVSQRLSRRDLVSVVSLWLGFVADPPGNQKHRSRVVYGVLRVAGSGFEPLPGYEFRSNCMLLTSRRLDSGQPGGVRFVEPDTLW